MRLRWTAALLVLLAAPLAAQADLGAPLPFDPAVRVGTLDNGLRYYVRQNTEPEGRAELRLAVDVGSIQEEEDQRGLAHFVEHMAFNGTERFDEPELVRYLESVGMRFGPGVNAYTSFDETVYMLQIPTDSAEVFETGVDVLREWAGRVTFEDEAIDRERGVILEEWRIGRGAQERIQREEFPVIFADSRYAERLPIGLPEVIENAPYGRFRDFYDDWYRPELMAVVAVGDFDPDAVEAMIRDKFASLENPPAAPAREAYTVPGHEETYFSVTTDPEAPQTIVRVLFKSPPSRTRTVGDYRAELVDDLFFAALRARIDEVRQEPGAPFAFAFAGSGSGIRGLDQAFLFALAAEGRVADAVTVLATEAERARRFGITESEFERQKAEVLRALESAVAERENQPSARLSMAYVQTFLRDEVAVAPDDQLALAQRLLPTVTLDEVNAVAETLVSDEDRVVLVSGPEGAPIPTEAELEAALAAVATAEIEPYADETSDAPLVPSAPTPGAVVAETTDADLGTTTWTLSNGATVILKPTDFKADEVLLRATSPGGTSLLSARELAVAGGAAGYVAQSGVGAFDQVALGKRLAGQIVNVSPTITDRAEGVRGSAAPADLETLFQLAHLYVVAPRKDADAFTASLEQARAFLGSQANSPRVAFSDTLSATLANGDPRSRTLTEFLDGLDRADLDRAFAFYQDRFSDVSDFTFVLVGAFEPEGVRPLVETYLASLPGTGRDEAPVDHPSTPPEGVIEKTVRAGVEPQAQVALVFHGEIDADDSEDRVFLDATADVLSKMLREELREDRGGVYGVGVRPSIDRDADRYQLRIQFGTDPERVEELVGAVFSEIETLKAGEFLPEHVTTFREQERRTLETNRQQNAFWADLLNRAASRGEDPETAFEEVELAQTVTVEMVRDMARQVLDTDRYVRVTLLPVEGAEGAAAGADE